MVNLEIRKRLNYGALVFDNPAYDESIIGQTFDGRAIYDIEKNGRRIVKGRWALARRSNGFYWL